MKKTLIIILSLSFGVLTYAQKNELKAAETALETNQYATALSALKTAEPMMNDAKTKQQAQYYFLLGKAKYANGTTPESFLDAANALNKVISLEKSSSKRYTDDAGNILNEMIQDIATKSSKLYEEAGKEIEDNKEKAIELLKESADGFEKVFMLSPRDTAFYQNAAFVNYKANEFQKSIEIYETLLKMGYTGAGTTYTATNLNGEVVGFKSEADMMAQVKLKIVSDPKIEVSEPQTIEMKKMIVKNYVGLNQNEKALEKILEARQEAPDDYGLLVDEAYVHYNLGDKALFKEKLEQAIQINPSDYILHYNIGVMKAEMGDTEGAIESYEKCIALNPDYYEAYKNIGAAILDKAKPIVEQMNESLNDFDKYDALQAQQLEVYKEALPYIEKAHSIAKNDVDIVQLLVGIYQQLEMNDKSKEMKELLNSLKE